MDESKVKKDAKEYENLATKGMDLMFPVRIKGRSSRPDVKVIYHMTIMLFNTEKDTSEEAHGIASRLALNPPDPRTVTLQTSTMKGRTGYTIYNINVIGPSMKYVKELHDEFDHMGFDNKYEFVPHITVDKDTWDQFHKYNGKTAFEAGIEFLPAELRKGDEIVSTYSSKHAHEHGSEGHLGKSEVNVKIIQDTISMNLDLLEKHSKATCLSYDVFSNYLQDNPGLEEQLLKKHEERVNFHFKDAELKEFAIKNGIDEAYRLLNRRK